MDILWGNRAAICHCTPNVCSQQEGWRWPSCLRRGKANVCHLRGLHKDQSPVCGRSATSRWWEKTNLCCSTHALAIADLGAGDRRRRKGGVSNEMSALARTKTSLKSVASARRKWNAQVCLLAWRGTSWQDTVVGRCSEERPAIP